ncbi:ABC-2 type transport system permease protein [Microbacter margulisiae]|uniref:ABC-2 type transport system permease protein n=2 Tax=Microbacter margulisiae TaxID=1350067 RepID=A0A7W5H2M2_9PORP|nr:ABC-2 type transport system permease protein [Microbacter margulisiae]
MKSLQDPLKVNVYLDGDLNVGFLRLKNATANLLDELKIYSKEPIDIHFIDPTNQSSSEAQAKAYAALENRGLHATTVYEKDGNGKAVEKVIFPWAEIIAHHDTVPVNLLVNIPGNSGDENLNASVEELEYQITDAIRRLESKEIEKIAFLEGNGELSEAEVYDASTALSRYFEIDRGSLGTDPKALDPFKVVIIAKPKTPFTEQEKFIIDQYIMHGGRVLWLVDGANIDTQNLTRNGQATILPLDVNLSDQLFCYGVRINPDVVEDVQCINVPVNVARQNDPPQFKPMPWFFSPLLLTSPYNPVTRNLGAVKADFASSIDLVGDSVHAKADILLVTSNASHILAPPAFIDLKHLPDPEDQHYFNIQNVPVAVALSGIFTSDFANQMVPEGIDPHTPIARFSKPTRMIVVSDGDIIRNDVQDNQGKLQALPLGYDRYSNRQYSNRAFIVNAVQYLSDQDGWMNLRSRQFKLRLLNRLASTEGKLTWQLINVLAPVLLLLVFAALYLFIRKKRFQ